MNMFWPQGISSAQSLISVENGKSFSDETLFTREDLVQNIDVYCILCAGWSI
jgi:hypothetical protein